MTLTREYAATNKHHVDGLPRLNTSRCGNNYAPAVALIQPSSGVKKIGDSMSLEIMAKKEQELSVIEQVVMQGDLSKLNPEQRVTYYRKVCESSGLNPFTNPFAYISLNGKLTLYAKKDCTEQLRKINGVSIEGLDDKLIDDIYVVTAKAKDKHGRIDQAKGAVVIGNLRGEAKANAIMKAETKAKRRVTLSICGMGWTDESEIDSIPNAKPVDIDLSTGEIKGAISPPVQDVVVQEKPKIAPEKAFELKMILEDCDDVYRNWVYDYIKKTFGAEDLTCVPAEIYDRMKLAAIKNMDKNHERQREEEPELIKQDIQ